MPKKEALETADLIQAVRLVVLGLPPLDPEFEGLDSEYQDPHMYRPLHDVWFMRFGTDKWGKGYRHLLTALREGRVVAYGRLIGGDGQVTPIPDTVWRNEAVILGQNPPSSVVVEDNDNKYKDVYMFSEDLWPLIGGYEEPKKGRKPNWEKKYRDLLHIAAAMLAAGVRLDDKQEYVAREVAGRLRGRLPYSAETYRKDPIRRLFQLGHEIRDAGNGNL